MFSNEIQLSGCVFVTLALGMCVMPDSSYGKPNHPVDQSVRVATFNTALSQSQAGALKASLQGGQNGQAKRIAEIIQRTQPDILVLQEVDWDASGEALKIFMEDYLAVSQEGAPAQSYPHIYQPTVNTGVPSGLDLSGNGRTDGPDDAFGFGKHPGQYGFAILSKHPFVPSRTRTFQNFLWNQMPGARLPEQPNSPGTPWYSDAAISALRLSSKNHVDATVAVHGYEIHLLVSHPTPPVFDGPENRNGLRNYDEIRFWADYLTPEKSVYCVDDTGQRGGLPTSAPFIIAGDLNADPNDGDSVKGAIDQLLDHPRIHPDTARGAMVPRSDGGQENARRDGDSGDPAQDTASWGLRVDYVLPSREFKILKSGVFWPRASETLSRLVSREKEKSSSDHRLIWVDVSLAPVQP